jgi:hypothetical protein
MKPSLESLPRRIFLDSCTAQALRDYGGYIYEAQAVYDSDPIHRVPEGIAKIEALGNIFLLNERALFEWIVSPGSMKEAHDKGDSGHMQWLWDIAHHSEVCLEGDGQTEESEDLAARLDEPKFGYLSEKDRLLAARDHPALRGVPNDGAPPAARRGAYGARTRYSYPDTDHALGNAAAMGALWL